MRHRNKTRKLGRSKAHRTATLRNLAAAIVQHQQIKTTQAKAKAAQSTIEKLITTGKKNTVAARREAFKLLQSHFLVKKLFEEIVPTFSTRTGGYSRIVKLGRRPGDGAELAILQLVGFEKVVVEGKKATGKKKKAAAEKTAPAKETPAVETAEVKTETEKGEAEKAVPEKEVKAKKAAAKSEKPKEKKEKQVKAKPVEKTEKKAKAPKKPVEKEKTDKKKSE